MKDQSILEALETLAAAMPWDTVDIWLRREPEGKMAFTAYVQDNSKFGFPSYFGHGETPMEAVRNLIKENPPRDPEICRKRKVQELQDQINRLAQVVVGLPPYRPGTQIPQCVDL